MLQPKTAYLTAISAWYGAFGMQSVVFAWLVTMVLREPAERVGIAQMTLLLPGMLLILIAGVLADRIGLRRQAAWSQLLAGLMPLLLAVAVYMQALSFTVMVIFALLSGCASAFLTPARDGLLNHVAGEDVQRTVMQASLCQFG
ncbi:MAG: MFS transporter, partial [Pseudomonadota bacterium]|nr:MFS transporter [Pseudomonadota bacterium]